MFTAEILNMRLLIRGKTAPQCAAGRVLSNFVIRFAFVYSKFSMMPSWPLL